MAQPLHNPLSLLKNPSQTSVDQHQRNRSRSSSFLRAISLHSPHPSTPIQSASSSTPTTKFSSTNDECCENALSCNPDDFEIKNPIGYGSSAVVYNAIFKPKNKRVAIKMIDLDLFERNQIDELRRETALMALSKHPNVLTVYGSFVKGSKLYIITPYLSGGSCLDIMKNGFQDGFEEVVIATILKQALEGLVYLHKNNHIHRDVKAGNLLMDDQGTVLLGDFGVSSSLTENNEQRKTFVGTPCWMAPEVMEQSGYDFKADIWSFGITSIELATGHAPFAKFAPMKVLMMTLNQEPPTLDRDNTKHKYSRIFKEMIDLCLQKDPTKRPTAEKLLNHPFFKLAKKKEYLIKTVLQQVPPLDDRPHKMGKVKQTTMENTAQWDFEEEEEEKEERGNSKQKHITFGEVTVNKSDNNKAELPSPSEQDIVSPAPIRKSRFVIEETSDNTVSSQQSVSPNNLSTHSGDALSNSASIFTQLSTNPSTAESSWQSSMGLGLGISSNIEGEVKKGRFSVNQATPKIPGDKAENSTPTASTTSMQSTPVQSTPTTTTTTPIQSIPETPVQEIRPVPMSQRKSRFEVQHNPPQPANNTSSPAPNIHGQLEHIPRESTTTKHHRNLSRDSAKLGRFSIEQDMIHPYESSPSTTPMSAPPGSPPEFRKKGRFELSGNMTPAERLESPGMLSGNSPRASITSSVMTPDLHAQVEMLLKQNEIQRTMLLDLLSNVNPPSSMHTKSRSASADLRKLSAVSIEPKQAEISPTLERLQHLLYSSNREKERLIKENECLRSELERVRKQAIPSILKSPPPSSILKSPSVPSSMQSMVVSNSSPCISLTSPDRPEPPLHPTDTHVIPFKEP
ncbi:kinase-like protein [Backusella circina FSU 941]|nr:kinase-like protein [Backusella circina FSU 941]